MPWFLMPTIKRVNEQDFPDVELALPPVELPVDLFRKPVTQPAPAPAVTHAKQDDLAFENAIYGAGLSEWAITSGKLIAHFLAGFMGIGEAPPFVWSVFAWQAAREDANGQSEGAEKNNPLNLKDRDGSGNLIEWEGRVGEWGNGFAAFDTLENGAKACALNYFNGPYAAVKSAFADGSVLSLATAIERSPWDADHYGYTLTSQVQDMLARAGQIS